MSDIKQVILIRRDLKMRRGKEIAQGSHASMAFLRSRLRFQPGLANEAVLQLSPAERYWITQGMAKAQTVFFCQNCGAQSPKWIGRWPSCGEWNTYVEEVVKKESGRESSMGVIKSSRKNVPTPIGNISKGKEERTE